jgi:hypothetical protein
MRTISPWQVYMQSRLRGGDQVTPRAWGRQMRAIAHDWKHRVCEETKAKFRARATIWSHTRGKWAQQALRAGRLSMQQESIGRDMESNGASHGQAKRLISTRAEANWALWKSCPHWGACTLDLADSRSAVRPALVDISTADAQILAKAQELMRLQFPVDWDDVPLKNDLDLYGGLHSGEMFREQAATMVSNFNDHVGRATFSFLGCVVTFVLEGAATKPWCGLYLYASRKNRRLLAFLLQLSPLDAYLKYFHLPEKGDETILSLHQAFQSMFRARGPATTGPFKVSISVHQVCVHSGSAARCIVSTGTQSVFDLDSIRVAKEPQRKPKLVLPFGLKLSSARKKTKATPPAKRKKLVGPKIAFDTRMSDGTSSSTQGSSESGEERVVEVASTVIKEHAAVALEKKTRKLGFLFVNKGVRKGTCIYSRCPCKGGIILGKLAKVAYQAARVIFRCLRIICILGDVFLTYTFVYS